MGPLSNWQKCIKIRDGSTAEYIIATPDCQFLIRRKQKDRWRMSHFPLNQDAVHRQKHTDEAGWVFSSFFFYFLPWILSSPGSLVGPFTSHTEPWRGHGLKRHWWWFHLGEAGLPVQTWPGFTSQNRHNRATVANSAAAEARKRWNKHSLGKSTVVRQSYRPGGEWNQISSVTLHVWQHGEMRLRRWAPNGQEWNGLQALAE